MQCLVGQNVRRLAIGPVPNRSSASPVPIAAARPTRSHLSTGKSYVYADRGETMLKGFEDAVRLYEVRWRE
jgi:hypothetical protein